MADLDALARTLADLVTEVSILRRRLTDVEAKVMLLDVRTVKRDEIPPAPVDWAELAEKAVG